MNNDKNAFRAGLFILVSIMLIGMVIVGISGAGRIFEHRQTRQIRFKLTDDVGGLRIGDDVRIGGFKVGQVRKIDVVLPDNDASAANARVLVTFQMPMRYVLKKDARVSIQSTVTGTSNLNFENLGTGPALADGEELVGKPNALTEFLAQASTITPDLRDMVHDARLAVGDVREKTVPAVNVTVTKAGATADAFTQTATSAKGLVEDVRAQVPPVIDKYNTVTNHGTQMMDQVRDLVGDTKSDFRGTISNLNAATGTIRTRLPTMLDQVQGVITKVDGSLGSAMAALDDIQKTMANARDVSATAKSIIGGNRGKFDSMISSLKSTSDNLKGASAEIRRSPWRLLYKPGPNDMANLNLYDSARQFAEGANDLNDASQALRDATQNQNTDKEQLQKLMDRVDKSFANFKEVEQKLWTSVKE